MSFSKEKGAVRPCEEWRHTDSMFRRTANMKMFRNDIAASNAAAEFKRLKRVGMRQRADEKRPLTLSKRDVHTWHVCCLLGWIRSLYIVSKCVGEKKHLRQSKMPTLEEVDLARQDI